MSALDARCGTPSGYRKHQREGDKPCDACAAAKREYDKRWRAGDERTRKARARASAQNAAHGRLAAIYPDTYRALYLEEKAKGWAAAGWADE